MSLKCSRKAQRWEVNYQISLFTNKLWCFSHIDLTARDLNPALRVLLTDVCALARLSSKHCWQAWLVRLLKNLSSRHAIKPEHSSKHCGSEAARHWVNWPQQISILAKYVFNLGLFNSVRLTDRDELEKFGQYIEFLLNMAKNNKLVYCRGLQPLMEVPVLLLQNIRGQWLYIKHQSLF